ncbi:glycine betaine/proline transport system permease protein [Geomicrobium halophilum]|uniref:Glycine betaine/proline transport system permease protein n=1 Tax=Geomicrobium halophilum TaxID=549000 RepID=A0A841PJZ6_9BACL|nr:proline/glycine betaine ABC transporter permease [Geomicrobium halophilum]MBB6449187.1 glycine betaine/proline transport system permease protein [Geomicrobium halophilum]
MKLFPSLPLAEWVEALVDWLTNADLLFEAIEMLISFILTALQTVMEVVPIPVFIIGIPLLTFFFAGRKIGLTIFVFLGLFLIDNLGFWEDMLIMLSLVLAATIISVVVGIPLGIWMSKSNTVEMIMKPILDFMQTLPQFVYLIPAVAFFGIGMEPGVIASVIFGMPPTIRLTNLGIREVSTEVIEAADAFGSTPSQKLYKVQLPMARTTIMAGVNQTIMLSLSMVVIASMIGADGLGDIVYAAVGRNDVGSGFEAGIAIVIVAIILDRLTSGFQLKQKKK